MSFSPISFLLNTGSAWNECWPSFALPSPVAPALLAPVWLAKASSAGWVDGVGLALVLLLLCLGALRGLWWQMVRLCGVIAVFSVARALAPRMSPRIESWFPDLSPRLANGLAWTLILIAGMLVVALVGRIGKAALDAAALSTFDRIGGALTGALSGLLIHAALIVATTQVAPRDFTARSIDGTHSQAWVAALDRWVPNLLDPKAREALAADRWKL
jgi:uncharacterized membrane protein required for colicin V production